MTELKTLKDFVEDEHYFREDYYLFIDAMKELKQEAIKDIKSIMELEKTPPDKWWEDMTGHRLTYSEEAKQGIINYIKWKNNITEDELK